MVLCQIYSADATSQLYAINVFGRKRVKIVKIEYMQAGGATDKIIALKSSVLRLPYGNAPYFVFATNPNHQVGNIHSDLETNCDFNGNFDLEVLDTATGAQPAGFSKICLTLDIKDLISE